MHSVRNAGYRTVLLNPDPKKPFDQIESGRYRGLNADVQAEAQERGEAGGGVREQDLRLPRDAAVSSSLGQPTSLTLSSSLFSG